MDEGDSVVAVIRTAEREEEGKSAPLATAPDPDDTGGPEDDPADDAATDAPGDAS